MSRPPRSSSERLRWIVLVPFLGMILAHRYLDAGLGVMEREPHGPLADVVAAEVERLRALWSLGVIATLVALNLVQLWILSGIPRV
jgi:hypothetical protein